MNYLFQNHAQKLTRFALSFLFVITAKATFAQTTYPLASLQTNGKLELVNRSAEVVSEEGKSFIRLSEDKGEGLVWLSIKDFSTGEVQIRLRGKDMIQRSFVGIAFHGQNDSTFEAVYCRPFNFFANDSIRNIHAIQYIAHPEFTWKKLREDFNGIYEKEIINPPNPNDWFTMRLLITKTQIAAYIDDNDKPSLEVEKISSLEKGKIGIFVGAGSGGDFEEIRITKK